MSRHYLKQVAFFEGCFGHGDSCGILPRLVVATLPHLGVALICLSFAGAWDAMRRVSVYFKFIAAAHRPLASMVNHDQFVREIEHQVALVGRALQTQPQRLKLKGEIVAKRTIQTQMRLRGAIKELHQHAQYGKKRGLLTALLLWEAFTRWRDGANQVRPLDLQRSNCGKILKHCGNGR